MRKGILALCLGLALIAGVFYSSQNSSVSAQQFPTQCIPLLGVTSGVGVPLLDNLAKEVENSGHMYFTEGLAITESNYLNSVPYPEYRVCVTDKGPQASNNDVRYTFEGWTIDSNLGWVSWACQNGKNKGRDCSSQNVDYQVEMTQGGRMQGFAYSDAAGWIGFYCETGKNVMSGQQFNCGVTDYGVQIDNRVTEMVCSNGVDDDGDNKTDLADPDCSEPYPPQNPIPPVAGVDSNKAYYRIRQAASLRHVWADSVGWFDMYGLEVPFGNILNPTGGQCGNGLDDDNDGQTDSDDPDCKGGSEGVYNPDDPYEDLQQCEDGLDNDDDGMKDYGFPWQEAQDGVVGNDPGCLSFTDNTENNDPSITFACQDGLDNDNDGEMDFPNDPGCSKGGENIENDVACSDDKDNDGDGLVDFENDPGCEGDPEGPSESNTLPAACGDGVDNDGDAKIDFNGKDTNEDGIIDVAKDDGCWGLADPSETTTTCSDGIDNDGDGNKDLADNGCSKYEDTNEADDPKPAPACNDGVDNDGDNLKDYPERGCYSPVDNSEDDKQCNDWADNDGDDFIDYNGKGTVKPDPQCSFGDDDSEALAQCKDGIDNDGDGKMDMGVNLDADAALEIPADDGCSGLEDPKEGPDCTDNTKTLQECLQVPQYGSYLTILPNPYTNPVTADGKSGYKIVLHLANGSAPYDNLNYNFEPTPQEWLGKFLEVNLYADQTDTNTKLQFADLSGLGFQYKTIDDKGLPLNSWVAYIQSPVPTTGIKTSFIVKPKSLALEGKYGDWKLYGNSLQLLKFKIDKIIKKDTTELQPGSCAVSADPASCGLVSKEAQLQGEADGASDLLFKPIVAVKKLTSDGERYLEAIAGVDSDIDLELVYQGASGTTLTEDKVGMELIVSAYSAQNAANTFIYEWLDTGSGSIANIDDPIVVSDSKLSFASLDGLMDALMAFKVRPMLAAEEMGDYVGQPSLVSIISYTLNGKTFKYVADALPDTVGQGIYNPGADIVGLIYSKVLDIPKEDNQYYSTGNLTSNVLRDTITANLGGILGSLQAGDQSDTADLVIDNDCAVSSGTPSVTEEVSSGTTLYYVNGQDVVLGDAFGAQMDCEKANHIVVVNGGNVFIDASLYSNVADRGKWSIIALRNKYGIESFKAGGNVYINKEVTDLYANIIADGSIFSYNGAKTAGDFQVDGRPKAILTDEDLQKQIYILGSIASWNTFGGSLKIDTRVGATVDKPYVLGNGQFTGDQELARVYDLNYLRRFKLYLERYNGVPIDQKCKNVGGDECNVDGDKKCTPVEQATLVNAGTPPTCYLIDAQNEWNPLFPDEGDLIDMDPDGKDLRAINLKPQSNVPVIIKYEAPHPNNPLFRLRKGASFTRPNF